MPLLGEAEEEAGAGLGLVEGQAGGNLRVVQEGEDRRAQGGKRGLAGGRIDQALELLAQGDAAERPDAGQDQRPPRPTAGRPG